MAQLKGNYTQDVRKDIQECLLKKGRSRIATVLCDCALNGWCMHEKERLDCACCCFFTQGTHSCINDNRNTILMKCVGFGSLHPCSPTPPNPNPQLKERLTSL
eukprot:6379455-Amphidinium_carterae.3